MLSKISILKLAAAASLAVVVISTVGFFQKKEWHSLFPRPTDGTEIKEGEEENEGRNHESGYEKYVELTRSLALGPNWREIGRQNMEAWEARVSGATERTSYAGGLLQGTFYERGCSNITGNIRRFDLYNDEWYVVGSSGSVWKGSLTGSTWTLLDQKTLFETQCLQVVDNNGTKRIILSYSGNIKYSDNDGSTWTTVTIPTYTSGRQMIELPNGDLYYLATTGSKSGLHRSTNHGTSWTVIQSWASGAGADKVTMWNPFETNELYLLDGSNNLYSISGATPTLLNVGVGMATGTKRYMSGYKNGAVYKFYVILAGNNVYQSTDNGANWVLKSDISANGAWDFTTAVNPANGDVFYGEVDFWKSSNEGVTWTQQNHWYDYYSNTNKLHADIMNCQPFRTAGGSAGLAISCHGGLFLSYDNLATTTNITASGLRYSDLYDVVTIGGNIMGGSQDQGWHRFNGGAGQSILTGVQAISGDYVRMNSSQNAAKLWAQYPNGDFAYYSNPAGGATDWYTIAGTANTNFQQWAVPTCNNGAVAQNSIYVGGGEQEGGGSTSSYLLKLTGGNPVTATQFNYDFRANNGNTGWIAAVENSPVDPNYLFVASSTGKFFYSWDGGSNWTKHPSLTGPSAGWLFGSFIYGSRLNKNKLWYCGAGGKVYQSLDGGVNFTSIINGMPNTFISELACNSTETVLFAATDAGPYAYLFQTGTWYALADATTPLVAFSSVEAVAGDIMRFSTQGRGVWDFQITAAPLPIELTVFDGKLNKFNQTELRWKTASEQNNARFDVERSTDGLDWTSIGQVAAKNVASEYRFTDFAPLVGRNYYRLRQFDFDGSMTLSPTIVIELEAEKTVRVFPNPAIAGEDVQIQNADEGQTISLFDPLGKLVFQQPIRSDGRTRLTDLPSAAYYFQVKNAENRSVSTGKLVIRR